MRRSAANSALRRLGRQAAEPRELHVVGMVLSEGSTEHGGYHEALIGLGTVIGPGAGALAEKLGGGSPAWGVAAVAGIIAASVVACGYVSARRAPEGDVSR